MYTAFPEDFNQIRCYSCGGDVHGERVNEGFEMEMTYRKTDLDCRGVVQRDGENHAMNEASGSIQLS